MFILGRLLTLSLCSQGTQWEPRDLQSSAAPWCLGWNRDLLKPRWVLLSALTWCRQSRGRHWDSPSRALRGHLSLRSMQWLRLGWWCHWKPGPSQQKGFGKQRVLAGACSERDLRVRRQIKPEGKLETRRGSGVSTLSEELKKAWHVFLAAKPRSSAWSNQRDRGLRVLTYRGEGWNGRGYLAVTSCYCQRQ